MGKIDSIGVRTNLVAMLACLPLCVAVAAVEPYEDQYILGSETGAIGDDFYAEEELELPGRRFVATELVYYNNDSDVFGSDTEQGLRMRWRHETLKFGELAAEVSLSSIDRDFINSQRNNTEAMITFRQQGAPIADAWTMNNAIGYQRTLTGGMLDGGYRVRLPSSPVLGTAGEFVSFDKSAQWFTGGTGRIEGAVMNQFEQDGGSLIGAGYQQEVSDRLSFGSQFVKFSGNDVTSKHSSLLGTVGIVVPQHEARYDISLLADDNANFGLWADGEQNIGDFMVRYGAFYVEPELAWMDKPISNDQLGYYIRTDKQSYRYSLAAGYDYLEFGLDGGDGSRSTSHNLYFTGNFRVSRNLSLGLAATVISRNVSSAQVDDQLIWRWNNFAFYRSRFGSSRFELYGKQVDTDLGTSDNDLLGVLVSHEWRMSQSIRLTTELRLEDSKNNSVDTSRREASVLFRQDLTDELSWGMNTTVYQGSGGPGSSHDGIGLNADLRWGFLPNWYVGLTWIHNTASFNSAAVSPLDDGDEGRVGRTFWLTVGHARTRGQPFQNLGIRNGGVGSGIVEGEVYVDENNDFMRQQGEKPVAGALVLLDGRYEAWTDSRGRYLFEPVYTGSHHVSIEVSELPLPWGLDDETPRLIIVGLRRPGEANFGLSRIE